MRRGVGVHAILKDKEKAEKFKERGQELKQINLAQVREQLEIFKKNLEAFAVKHKEQLKKDPEFRQYFNELCSKIGVDPLVSNKGFWGQLLGVGDFYYELGIQIIEICIKTRPMNGGLMHLDDVLIELRKKRGSNGKALSKDDIERAVKQLAVLGSGFSIIRVGSKKLLQSVPYQLSNDHTAILELAQSKYYVTKEEILTELKWSPERFDLVIQELLDEGMVWLDVNPSDKQVSYWFPTLYMGAVPSNAHSNSSSSAPT